LPAGRATLTGAELRKIAEIELKILCHHHLMQLYLRAVYLEGKVKRIAPTYHVAITFQVCELSGSVSCLVVLVSHLKTMYTFSIEEVLEFSKSYIHAHFLDRVPS
jgi:hypothetical protein